MRAILLHPGSSYSTHDVFMGLLDGLQAQDGVDLSVYPLDMKLGASTRFLLAQWRFERRLGRSPRRPTDLDVQLQACDGLLTRILIGRPDWLIVVTGMFVPLAVLQVAKRTGVKIALLLTESPYDEHEEARLATVADVVFTNERRTAERRGWHYLPHAWRKGVHDAAQAATLPEARDRCLFVGSAFPERVTWLQALIRQGAPIDLYGAWDDVPEDLAAHVKADVIANEKAAQYAKAYGCALNLYRSSRGWYGDRHIAPTDAYSLNPRAYELARLGVPHLSSPRAETREKFGDLVPTTDDPQEAAEIVERLTRLTSQERRHLAGALIDAVRGDHWHARAEAVREVLDAAA